MHQLISCVANFVNMMSIGNAQMHAKTTCSLKCECEEQKKKNSDHIVQLSCHHFQIEKGQRLFLPVLEKTGCWTVRLSLLLPGIDKK